MFPFHLFIHISCRQGYEAFLLIFNAIQTVIQMVFVKLRTTVIIIMLLTTFYKHCKKEHNIWEQKLYEKVYFAFVFKVLG